MLHEEHGGVAISPPDWSPDGRRIAFSRVDPTQPGNVGYGRSTIVTIALADGSIHEHTRTGDEWWPKWSRDGTELYYYRGLTDDLEGADVRSDTVRSVGPSFIGWRPAVDPRTGRLAFVSDLAGLGLWIGAPDDQVPPRLLLDSGNPDTPAFLPDGSGLVFSRDTASTMIVCLDPVTGRLDTLGRGVGPQALASGAVIALGDGRRGSHLVRILGTVVDTVPLPFEHVLAVATTPDGQRILLSAPGVMTARHDLYLVEAGDPRARPLTSAGEVLAGVWCDDRQTVAYASRGDKRRNAFRGLWLRNVAEPNPSPALDDPPASVVVTDCDGPDQRLTYHYNRGPPGVHVRWPGRRGSVVVTPTGHSGRWSPDGTQLVFLDQQAGQTDVFLRRRGGTVVRLTNDTAVESAPSWTTDGSQVVFGVRTPNRGIWLLRFEGPTHPVP